MDRSGELGQGRSWRSRLIPERYGPVRRDGASYGGHGVAGPYRAALGGKRSGGRGGAVIFWRHGARVPAICE